MSRVPLIAVRITPPPGLTQKGSARKFQEQTKKNIQQTLETTSRMRAEALRAEMLATYNRRSTGETARSVKASPAKVTNQGVEAAIFVGGRALRFITNWAGLGRMIEHPGMDIFPKRRDSSGRFRKARLAFRGWGGELVVVQKVHHPGFKKDVISSHMEVFSSEVSEYVIDTVARSTVTWVNGLGQPQSRRLTRQYR